MPTYTIPQIMMTLSAIAYAGDTSKDIGVLSTAIKAELAKQKYATQNQWQLVWGPILTEGDDNLAFVVSDGTDLAFVLRGTVGFSGSFFEDVPTGQAPPYWIAGDPEVKISTHFLEAIDKITQARDRDGLRIWEFLQAQSYGTLYVTGHSQGGGLTPAMMTLMIQEANNKSVEGFAFAPPTCGNAAFANNVDAQHNNGAPACALYINKLDIVPLGYNNIAKVVGTNTSDGIPIPFPDTPDTYAMRALIDVVEKMVNPNDWAHSSNQHLLGPHPYPPINFTPPGESFADIFISALGMQHNHNSYLVLLGAPQTDVGDPSVLGSV